MGQTKAAQALAKLTITSNPEMTFPGERVRGAADGPEVAPGRVCKWGASLTSYWGVYRSTRWSGPWFPCCTSTAQAYRTSRHLWH